MEERVVRKRFKQLYFTSIQWLSAILLLLANAHSSAENRVMELDFAGSGLDMAVAMQDLFHRPPSAVKLFLDTPQDGPVRLSLKPYQPFKKSRRTLLDGQALTDSELGTPKAYFRGGIEGMNDSFAFLSIDADGEASVFVESPLGQISGDIANGVFHTSNNAPVARTDASSVNWPNNDVVTLPSISPPEPPSAAKPGAKSLGAASTTTTQTIEMDVAKGWYGWGRSITVPSGQARVGIMNRGPGVAVVYVSSDPNFANVDHCEFERCFIENPAPGKYYVRAYKFDNTDAEWIPDLPSQASFGFSEDLSEGELHLATIAVELDNALFAQLGSTAAVNDYLAQLMAYNSAIYEEEANTQLQLGDIILYSSDPYPFTNDSGTRLDAVSEYWRENGANVYRTLLMHLSAEVNNGGVASLNTLCSLGGGYSVSGVDGLAPSGGQSINWDALVTSHELGHNFGSPHTHCYAGVEGNSSHIDGCYADDLDNTGACYRGVAMLPGRGALTGGSPGSQNGTIMSYCHVRDGGLSNIAPTFGLNHPYGVEADRVSRLMARITSQVATAAPECLSGFAVPPEEPISTGLPVWLLYIATEPES